MILTLINCEDGQALVEYGLILGLVFVVCVAALLQLGLAIKDVLYPGESELLEIFN
jgi:Flp pilus assembly pilin Flp